MPSHARTVTRTTHRVRNALLVVLLLLVVCAAAAGFSGFKLYKSAMSAKAHLNNVVTRPRSSRTVPPTTWSRRCPT